MTAVGAHNVHTHILNDTENRNPHLGSNIFKPLARIEQSDVSCGVVTITAPVTGTRCEGSIGYRQCGWHIDD